MLFHNRKQNKKSYIIKNILFCELNFLFIVSDTCVWFFKKIWNSKVLLDPDRHLANLCFLPRLCPRPAPPHPQLSSLQCWSPTGRSLASTKCVRPKLFNNINDLSRYPVWALQAPSMRKTIRVRPLPLLSWSFVEWACQYGLKCNLDACFLDFFFIKVSLAKRHSWKCSFLTSFGWDRNKLFYVPLLCL